MTRIIAGTVGGRAILTPPGTSTRPTSDRAREGLFAAVTADRGGSMAGARVLDLYAGSGAVGLEALSRGAADAVLVESDPRATRVIQANIDALGLPGARLLTGRAEAVLARGPGELPGRDFVFADPPYALADSDTQRLLRALISAAWLVPSALVVVERSSRSGPLPWPPGYVGQRSRRYGETTLWYGRAAARLDAIAQRTGA